MLQSKGTEADIKWWSIGKMLLGLQGIFRCNTTSGHWETLEARLNSGALSSFEVVVSEVPRLLSSNGTHHQFLKCISRREEACQSSYE